MPKVNIERDELITLLPHKGKMFLLTRLTAFDTAQRSLSAEYDVTADCLFYDPELGGVPGWVSFEFMAQSIAVLSGLSGREKGDAPKPGFILSVTNMEIKTSVLPAGTTVRIDIREDCRVEEIFSFDCTVSDCTVSGAGAAVASGKLTVMDVNDLAAFEKG